MKKTLKIIKALPKLLVPILGLIIVFVFINAIFNTKESKPTVVKKEVVSPEQTEKLERCAYELLEKNQNMMSPPVGVWGTLRGINVVVEGSKIKVIYYANHLFTNERRKGLDMSQKAFTRDTECSPSVITTWAE